MYHKITHSISLDTASAAAHVASAAVVFVVGCAMCSRERRWTQHKRGYLVKLSTRRGKTE